MKFKPGELGDANHPAKAQKIATKNKKRVRSD
jgi:hypothetical protein